MKISIVIPVINEATLVGKSIDRAWESGCDEVVVADGGSTDGTLEMLPALTCVFASSDPGRGIQMNNGTKIATGDLFLFLHADNWLVPGACDQIRTAKTLTQKPWGGFRQQIDHDGFAFRLLEKGNAWRVKLQGLVYGDQAFFVTRTAFEQIGGFPEIPLMEDFELSRRLSRVSRPLLLPGPVHVDPRRWEKNGIVRQTMKNWSISLAYRFGKSPEALALRYRRHDDVQ